MSTTQKPAQSLELDAALAQLSGQIQAVGDTELVDLKLAAGRVLAEPVVSSIQVPRENNSAMDGYALRAEDLAESGTRDFTLIGTSLAGVPWDGVVGAGECVRIMTGAVLPAGSDTVVIQEDITRTDESPNQIGIGCAHEPGDNIRYAGEEIQPGDTLFEAGRKLSAIDVGLLASLGIAEVLVRQRVRVGVLSTGDELREPGETLPPGCIYNSNRYMLSAAAEKAGAIITEYENGADDPDALRELLGRAAQQNDLLLTSGGVSVGDVDFVQEVLRDLGEVEFWKLRIKPGKPLLFGCIGTCKVLGLPGNPVSAAVTFALVGLPLLRALAGQQAEPVLRVNAILAEDLAKRPGRRDFQRGVLSESANGTWLVSTTGPQGSHRLTSLTRANCLIDLPADSGSLAAGAEVYCLPMSSLF